MSPAGANGALQRSVRFCQEAFHPKCAVATDPLVLCPETLAAIQQHATTDEVDHPLVQQLALQSLVARPEALARLAQNEGVLVQLECTIRNLTAP